MMPGLGISELFMGVLGVIFYILVVYPWWRIFDRTGKPKWLAFLMGITPINIIVLYWFAFTEWE
mgnify:CR=1 FL=1